jgi:hypothetical protein
MPNKNKPKTGKAKPSALLKEIKQKVAKSSNYPEPKKIISRRSGSGG